MKRMLCVILPILMVVFTVIPCYAADADAVAVFTTTWTMDESESILNLRAGAETGIYRS